MFEKELADALLSGRPYFGQAMRALQGPPVRHKYFLSLVNVVAKRNISEQIRILEIGSWAGASTVSWAKATQKLGRDARIICVDLWQPYFDVNVDTELHYREMNEAAENGKILKLFLHNIEAAKVSHMVDYFVGNARDILPKVCDNTVDIVYIDASHVYESVRADIQDAKRLVRDGGIICGDDLEIQLHEVDSREHKAAVALGKDYSYSQRKRVNYHPGVTEAVAAELGEVSAWEGIWAMRKGGSEWSKIELDLTQLELPEHIAAGTTALRVREIEETRDFRLLSAEGKCVAVAKTLESSRLFVERLGESDLPPLLFTGESLDEVRTKAVQVEEKMWPVAEVIAETREFNLVRIKERFLAVAKSIGSVSLLLERLGERDLPPVLFVGDNLEEVCKKAAAFETEPPPIPELVGETSGFNLVKAGNRFLAIAKSLGVTALMMERLGERELAPLILVCDGLEEVRERAIECERENSVPDVELIEEIAGYNLVKAEDRFIAIAKNLGPINLFRERLGERELPPFILIATDLTALRSRILWAAADLDPESGSGS